MPNRPQFTTNQFIDAIPGTGGIISTIAKRVGCQWHTAKKYIDNYPTIKRAYDDEVELILDLAETELLKKVREGDFAAVKYYLSTKGARRGFAEKREVTGLDGGSLIIEVKEHD